MTRCRTRLVILAGAVALLFVAAAPEKSSETARRDLRRAAKILNTKRYEKGISLLERIVRDYPGDRSAVRATELLREFGVGEEVRLRLIDRAHFRRNLKMPDQVLLERVESTLLALRQDYDGIEELFTEHSLEFIAYDSQTRYRKAGGSVTSGGHYMIADEDPFKRKLMGRVEWYLPPYARVLKDRELLMQAAFYHECVHYLNSIYFGRTLPPVLEEGLATHFTSRLSTEYYRYFRTTERQKLEANCRNALSWIQAYPDFLKFLDARRGFGRGDNSVARWYGLCYAVVDFFAEGEIGGERASREKLLRALMRMSGARPEDENDVIRQVRLKPRRTIERLVREFYDADLKTFHRALVARVLKEYRQQ